jgi:HlyD family secretion protein
MNAPAPAPAGAPRIAVSGPMRAGAAASLALLAAAALWAAVTPIGGAVIAPGQVVVRGQPKTVQSLDGGVIAAIAVANGDRVAAGQVLMRLDPTLIRVNLDITRNRLAEALARQARLEAEHRGLAAPVFAPPPDWLDGLDPAPHREGQAQIFAARAEVLAGRKAQLGEMIAQLGIQRTGIAGQIAALEDQLGYLEADLANVRALADKGLARESQRLDLQRARAQLIGQIAEQQAALARAANGVREAEMQILQAEREFREQVVTELRAATAEAEELTLQIVTLARQLDRIELRAPAEGVVHDLQVTTVGGVAAPGATLMQIVPLAEGVEFELRLDPRAIDEVFVGQRARVMLPALPSRSTPEIFGTLTAISPGTVTDPLTGLPQYRLVLAIPPDEIARLGGAQLLPGMPVDAFLQTGERRVLDYLLRPLADQVARAFRDS